MIKIKKLYSEYYVNINILSFLEIEEFKIRVFKYLVKHLDGEYEAILNVSFREEKEFDIDPNIEIELDEYYSHFSSFGRTEDEAIEKLMESINKLENLEDKKNKKIKLMF